jgi:phosphoserine phosphatase
MRILLIRHGQTQWNQVERFRGHFDVPLNEVGLAQAEATASHISAQWNPTAIYSSPLSRAMVTAQKIAQPFNLTVIPDPGLMDIDFGQWQGLSVEEVHDRWPDETWNWLHAPTKLVIPGGDSFLQVQTRALDFISRLLPIHKNGTIVLVSHIVVNRLIMLGLLGLDINHFRILRQDNCGINLLKIEGDEFFFECMNDISHLQNTRW